MRIFMIATTLLLLIGVLGNTSTAAPPPATGSTGQQAQPAKAVDPVCGMQIDPAKAAGKSDYKGKTYYFCSDHCKKTFDANPEAVLNKPQKKK